MGHCMLCKPLESLLNLLYDATAWCGWCNLCVDKHMVVFIFAHFSVTLSSKSQSVPSQSLLYTQLCSNRVFYML